MASIFKVFKVAKRIIPDLIEFLIDELLPGSKYFIVCNKYVLQALLFVATPDNCKVSLSDIRSGLCRNKR